MLPVPATVSNTYDFVQYRCANNSDAVRAIKRMYPDTAEPWAADIQPAQRPQATLPVTTDESTPPIPT